MFAPIGDIAMAEKHEIMQPGNVNGDGKVAMSLAESSSRAQRCRRFVKALFGSSKKGAVLPSEPSSSSSSSSLVCSSTRIERILRSRTRIATKVDLEIEASKDHWSELEQRSEESSSDVEDERVHLTNAKIVESLQNQFPQISDFFRDGAGYVQVGEKIAEGGQAEIFTAKLIGYSYGYCDGYRDYGHVLKVFKEGSSMRDLQNQWPLGMLNRYPGEMSPDANSIYTSLIWGGTIVMNGRFAFVMTRYCCDLRKLIDKRMERNSNNNRCPPLNDWELERNMKCIAKGMKNLHKDNIIHRDLKAANVLISVVDGPVDEGHIFSAPYRCRVADYECSVGVVGTGFWRAPEILQGVKDHNITPGLFTKKADVYSFAMTCYEMVSGQIPFEDVPLSNYDVVLRGDRPILPEGTKPWIKKLLSRCWHHDPSERPNLADIVKCIGRHSV